MNNSKRDTRMFMKCFQKKNKKKLFSQERYGLKRKMNY